MDKKQKIKNHKTAVISYIARFILSLILTVLAYLLTLIHQNSYHRLLSHEILIPLVLAIAFIQLIVQLIFFLHLGRERKPRWNLAFFVSTFSIVLLIVLASVWIMQNLNYNMTPADRNEYILKNEGMHSQ